MNTEETLETFGGRLKALRKKLGYTQEKLARLTNMSPQNIRRYEQGGSKEDPRAVNLLRIALVLDVTPEFLLYGRNCMNTYTEAIERELKQLSSYEQILEIKERDLNATVLAHLELGEGLVNTVRDDWNKKGIFKRISSKSGETEDSYCTRPYVQQIILRYCQNRSFFRSRFGIEDGMR